MSENVVLAVRCSACNKSLPLVISPLTKSRTLAHATIRDHECPATELVDCPVCEGGGLLTRGFVDPVTGNKGRCSACKKTGKVLALKKPAEKTTGAP